MELNKTLFEDNNIEVVDEQFVAGCIASIHNKTDKDIEIKFGAYNIESIQIKAEEWQDLFDDAEDFKALALLVKGCFTVEIVEYDFTDLFLFEMALQGITTLKELFENITEKERTALVNAVCSSEFIKVYKNDKGE